MGVFRRGPKGLNLPAGFRVAHNPRAAPYACLTAEGKEAAKNFSGSDPQSRVLFRLKEGPATAATLASDEVVQLDAREVKQVLTALARQGLVMQVRPQTEVDE